MSLQVRKGHLVFDPFAGTGSILIAAAHLGAHTLGSDIDIRVLRDGKIASNGQVCFFCPLSTHRALREVSQCLSQPCCPPETVDGSGPPETV